MEKIEKSLRSTYSKRNGLPKSGSCKVWNETFTVSEIEEIDVFKKRVEAP